MGRRAVRPGRSRTTEKRRRLTVEGGVVCERGQWSFRRVIEVAPRSDGDSMASCPDGVELVKIDAEGTGYDTVCTTLPARLRSACTLATNHQTLAGLSFKERVDYLQAQAFRGAPRERVALSCLDPAWWERRGGRR